MSELYHDNLIFKFYFADSTKSKGIMFSLVLEMACRCPCQLSPTYLSESMNTLLDAPDEHYLC